MGEEGENHREECEREEGIITETRSITERKRKKIRYTLSRRLIDIDIDLAESGSPRDGHHVSLYWSHRRIAHRNMAGRVW